MIVQPADRGYVVLYRSPQLCPGCGRSHWHVGRHSAECALCGTVLSLAPVEPDPAPLDRGYRQ